MLRPALLIAALLVQALPAVAQPHAGHHHHGAQPPSIAAGQPYAGLQSRAIKALSAEQAADLLAGRGMALALAAELNGYPGPMHVLEHAEALGLTPAQRARAEALREAMATEARAVGARILAAEGELDALFAGGQADAGRLAALTASLGAMQGRLRETHLATHIAMRDAMTDAQRRYYAVLRGYAAR